MTLAAEAEGQSSSAELLDASADVLAPHLDAQLGPSVTDPSIFRALAAKWEVAFFDDMARLGVERPTTLTRVSEFVPEIIEFTQKIIDRGYGYADDKGNVWFDTKAFDGAQEQSVADLVDGGQGEGSKFLHSYAKLAPWSKGNRELLEEGEGSLSTSTATTSGKRSAADFGLWKSSKPGEPAWPSTWGPGRPGGTSSAASWRAPCWARRSTSTPAASTSCSRTTTTSSRRPRRRWAAASGSTTSSTRATCTSRGSR